MTEEQKEKLIAKMLDSPSSLSDEELEMMTLDEELRDIYEISSSVSGACMSAPHLEPSQEWMRFRPRIMRRPSPMRWIMRVAAIFLGIAFVSAVVVRMIDSRFTPDNRPHIAMLEPIKPSDTAPLQPSAVQEAEECQVADASPAARMLEPSARPRVAKAVATCCEPPSECTDIDIDEYLRIQQARTDNELAVLTADAMSDELAVLHRMCDIAGLDDQAVESAIRCVTMQ